MCGICGDIFVDQGRAGDGAIVARMTAALRHRGPDHEGVLVGRGFGLGASRLSILDLSAAANQPLSNEDGTIHLVFNGEIYNFRALRAALEEKGHVFRSNCDAEAVVHLFEQKGVDCLADLRGMFALAIFDEKTRTLFAARDRLGKKPFYYRHGAGGGLLFASEIKSLAEHPDFAPEPDHDALREYLSLGYVPGEATAFRGVRRLAPAHYMVWKEGRLSVRRYGRVDRRDPIDVEALGGERGVARALREKIGEAVRMRLVSDVPLGVLLSGGIDSSGVAALAAEGGGAPPRTFSIGFEEADYNELPHAERVASLLGTRHTSRAVRPDAAEILPKVVRHLEEPFADSSALATWCAAELASESVKVVLNGDGGDETFAGYLRYAAHCLVERAAFLPSALRTLAGRAGLAALRGRAGSAVGFGERLKRALKHAGEPAEERYFHWVCCFGKAEMDRLLSEDLDGGAEESSDEAPGMLRIRSAWRASTSRQNLDRLLDVDLATYLPGDLLVKMDRMCMAWSVEARSPLLDHELLEFAARIPPGLKLRPPLGTKHILRKAFEEILPPAVLGRPKAGFGVPIDAWLRGPLRDFVRDILLGQTTRARGLFDLAAAETLLGDHLSGRRNWEHDLWAILMFQLWLEAQ